MARDDGLIEGFDGVLERTFERGLAETAAVLARATADRDAEIEAKRAADRAWHDAIIDSCRYRSTRATGELAGISHVRVQQILQQDFERRVA
jgi:hypothetical protein